MPRHPLRQPAARRASARPRVLSAAWLPDLTTARFAYTALQLDLLFYLLSAIEEVGAFRTVELWMGGLSEASSKKHNYRYVAAAAAALVTQPLTLRGQREQYRPLRLFERIRSLPGQGVLQIKLARASIPYLLELPDLIPATSLRAFLQLSSKHANLHRSRLQADAGPGGRAGPRKATRLKVLRKHVLEAAVQQINATTDLRITCQLEKHGRAVFYLAFTVKSQALPVLLPAASLDVEPATE